MSRNILSVTLLLISPSPKHLTKKNQPPVPVNDLQVQELWKRLQLPSGTPRQSLMPFPKNLTKVKCRPLLSKRDGCLHWRKSIKECIGILNYQAPPSKPHSPTPPPPPPPYMAQNLILSPFPQGFNGGIMINGCHAVSICKTNPRFWAQGSYIVFFQILHSGFNVVNLSNIISR